jgi:SAM-dependent methyltransferase
MSIPAPSETDYPAEMFRRDLPPELRVGCSWAYFRSNFIARWLFRRRLEVVFEQIPQRKFKRALDLGTGVGYVLPALANLAEEVVGADLSPVIRYAATMLDKRGLRNVRLIMADLSKLPFVSETFDLVVCLSVIEHIPDLQAAFAEMRRALRKGGTLLIGYPMEHAIFRFLEELLRMQSRWQRGRPKGEAFRPHVSKFHEIERSCSQLFEVNARRDIRLIGLPIYRVLHLEPT